MNEQDLKKAIQLSIDSTPYKIWTIGITDDCTRRKGEHEAEGKSCSYWRDWKADTEAIARNVEAYFLAKGMEGGAGGGEHLTYVYRF